MLVIYGHLLEVIFPGTEVNPFNESAFLQWQAIYSFHMPLFFLVSGAVNRNLPSKSLAHAARGTLKLWAMAWLAHLAGALLSLAIFYDRTLDRTLYENVFGELIEPIIRGESFSIGVLWFLMSLGAVQFLAWLALRCWNSFDVTVFAIAAGFTFTYFASDITNYYLIKTWLPGFVFFTGGYFMAQRQAAPSCWLFIPLLAAAIFLAPFNTGCPFTLARACPNVSGHFGIWNFAGVYGFLPLFYLTAFLGSLGVDEP